MTTDQAQPTLHALLRARQKLLHSYWHLIQIPPYDKEQVADSDINDFCQQLVDYAARWHLQARHALQVHLDGRQISKSRQARRDQAILETIDAVLLFDEFCAKRSKPTEHQRWQELLSLLGEELAKRFEHEDYLIIKGGLSHNQTDCIL